jgi:hypothetical protein
MTKPFVKTIFKKSIFRCMRAKKIRRSPLWRAPFR